MNYESRGFTEANYDDTASANSKDLPKVLIGALAGAAVGSLIAGAFTQKGLEVRSRIGESSRNIASSLKDKVSDVSGAIADKYESAKESAADLIEKGKQKVGMSSSSSDYKNDPTYMVDTTYADIEEDDDNGSASKILLGAVIVSVASTIIWSFATEKGNETRRRIAKSGKNMASNLKEKITDVAGDIAENATNIYESAKEGAADLIEQQKQRLNTQTPNTSFGSSTGADNW